MPDAAELRKRVGDRIRTARRAEGLSLRQLAVRLTDAGSKVSAQAISQWERGDTSPAPHTYAAVADALRVPWTELFAPDEDEAA